MFDKIMDIVNEIAGGDAADSGADLRGFDSYLQGVDWPIGKSDLISAMEKNGAGSDVIDQVERINLDTFSGPGDLVAGFYGSKPDVSETIRTRINELSPNLRDDVKKKNIL
jgi:hypothetical protein